MATFQASKAWLFYKRTWGYLLRNGTHVSYCLLITLTYNARTRREYSTFFAVFPTLQKNRLSSRLQKVKCSIIHVLWHEKLISEAGLEKDLSMNCMQKRLRSLTRKNVFMRNTTPSAMKARPTLNFKSVYVLPRHSKRILPWLADLQKRFCTQSSFQGPMVDRKEIVEIINSDFHLQDIVTISYLNLYLLNTLRKMCFECAYYWSNQEKVNRPVTARNHLLLEYSAFISTWSRRGSTQARKAP